MSAFEKVLAFGIAVAACAAPGAASQTPSGVMQAASIAAPGEKSAFAGKWTCISSATVEVAPVSFDTRGLADAWVLVHRDKGEIIAAERIGREEVEQIRRLPCGAPDSKLGGAALVG